MEILQKEKYYKLFAEKLKTSFNKPISAGDFGMLKKNATSMRDKDGSTHGNNMVYAG